MTGKKVNSLAHRLLERRFQVLMIFLLIMLGLSPLLGTFFRLRMFLNLSLSVVLIAGIFAVSHNKNLTILGILLSIPLLLSFWGAYGKDSPTLFRIGQLCGILFFALIILVILSFIFREKRVTRELIYGAVVVYLFLGLMGGFVFMLMESLQPGSFDLAAHQGGDLRNIFFYYSFVTLTTLGYGDITPLTNAARNFSVLEAILGQIYLTVLVARLVGLHLSQSMEKE